MSGFGLFLGNHVRRGLAYRWVVLVPAVLVEKQDRVLVVSLPEFLIHTGRHSVWPWPYLWFGVDRYAAEHTEGGFAGMLSELERSDPALLLICRRWNGPLRRRFDAWALPRYTRQRVWFYPHTVRPMNVYRRRTGSG